MRVIGNLLNRNLKLFFRDKASVFFSLLSVIILIALYLVFLADVQYDSVVEVTGKIDGIRWLINSWIMAGLVSIISFTSTLGAFGIMVNDKERENSSDFLVSPINNVKIVFSYVGCAGIVGIIMTALSAVVAEIFICISGGEVMEAKLIFQVIGIMLLSVLMATAITMFISSLIKTSSSFTAVSTVIGTLIGFLTGIYIPIGSLPSAVQKVIMVFPPSHAGLILKKLIMEKPLDKVFHNAPAEALQSYKETYGVDFILGGHNITMGQSILYIVAVTVVFLVLTLIVHKKSKVK